MKLLLAALCLVMLPTSYSIASGGDDDCPAALTKSKPLNTPLLKLWKFARLQDFTTKIWFSTIIGDLNVPEGLKAQVSDAMDKGLLHWETEEERVAYLSSLTEYFGRIAGTNGDPAQAGLLEAELRTKLPALESGRHFDYAKEPSMFPRYLFPYENALIQFADLGYKQATATTDLYPIIDLLNLPRSLLTNFKTAIRIGARISKEDLGEHNRTFFNHVLAFVRALANSGNHEYSLDPMSQEIKKRVRLIAIGGDEHGHLPALTHLRLKKPSQPLGLFRL